MLRDLKCLRRNSGKNNEEIENVPVNPRDSLGSYTSTDSTRPPLNTIQDQTPTPKPNPKLEQEATARSQIDRTPTKTKSKNSESSLPLQTPDKHGGVSISGKNRFGWAQRNETNSITNELRDEVSNYSMQMNRGGLISMTPRSNRTAGRANSGYSESNSTQSTPTRSVSKPPSVGFRNKVDGSNGGGRAGNFAALYRGLPVSGGSSTSTVVNTVEVPHFDLKEAPSFWMDHNVQVLIRVRPLNSMEKSVHGYNRCLKQECAQSITWIGQPETRFTFDHVACETVDQEMLFRMAGLPMVENCLSGYNSCMFAYGQTGSGKTYTMLGEIDDLEVRPGPHRGMTPRIFEFLFARIQAEEESRMDERLKYNCKCSFLEIHNEQITDLLDPSSTNLVLREDIKKGVYVENLSEFEVQTVSDILKLLTQGSSNRKVAATNMNRESSRSHSVFTCVIESRWEKDSTTNLRFARLNLVDLAGSERQKSSGAEGERLKEAANINKSLSTLGHVIMILVDIANGKPRHVPYRDSRLTFLLQDSLGGNSKTMIIANVSPSISCAVETLNTLKFAQRAKLIQNNAVVNEDSTGDIIALQHQIRLLKEELSVLKRQNVFRPLSFGSSFKEDTIHIQDGVCIENASEANERKFDNLLGSESKGIVRMSSKQLKSLETTLAGALRREQMAETSIKKLEAEIEQLNRLVRQREEDTRSTKMMLRFREAKIQRMESLLDNSFPPDAYLVEENRALCEENQLLQAKVDKNPEVTRFALENIRLLDQLRRFQEFYEEGEREILLEEVSRLREQLLQFLEGKPQQQNHPNENGQPQEAMSISKENNSVHLELQSTINELEECRKNLNSCLEENQRLSREIQDLHFMLDNVKSATHDRRGNIKTIQDSLEAPTSKLCMDVVQNEVKSTHATSVLINAEEFLDLQLELDILKIILKEERSSRGKIEDRMLHLDRHLELEKEKLSSVSKQFQDATHELKEAKLVVEALDSQQLLAINEMEDLRKSNSYYLKVLSEKELEIMALKEQLSRKELRDHLSNYSDGEDSTLQKKLKRMQDSLEKAKRLNMWYQNDCALQASDEEEMDEVCRQAEAETAEVIVCMQEELSILQQQVQDCHLKDMESKKSVTFLENEMKELQGKLYLLTEENKQLHGKLEEKDGELRKLSEEWEFLVCDMEEVLANGQEALTDASDQLDVISSSFPQRRVWISEQVGMLVRIISEKELLIEELGKCLEVANNERKDVECMLKSLRGAALVINEAHQQECSEREKEILFLKSQLREKTSIVAELEDKVNLAEHFARRASVCTAVAFALVNRLSEVNLNNLNELKHKDIQLSESAEINLRQEVLLNDQAVANKVAEQEIQSLRMELSETKETCAKIQQRLSEEETCARYMERRLEDIQDNEILKTKEKLAKLKTGVSSLKSCMSIHVRDDESPEMNETQGASAPVDGNDVWADAGEDIRAEVSECSLKIGKSLHNQKDKELRTLSDRDVTIILLKKEIESALQSLQEVQVEMAKLHNEKEEIWMSEKKSQESMKCFTTQLLAFQSAFCHLENQFESRVTAVNHKLLTLEKMVHEAGTQWCHTKEFLEMEVGDAKIVAAQKAAETSCIFAKFEEAQDTVKEADIMINELVIANERMKLDMERLKETQIALMNERDMLTNEVQCLQSINELKDQQFEDLEEQFSSNLMETTDLVMELESTIAQAQTSFNENFMSMACDFHCMKALVSDSGKVVRSWLEDVWSEIIVKDCAVSVLHLCHMGILLETVAGLNVENGLLQHGLCESNSLIADLKEHNSKSSRELQMCRTLKGKLLADIKNSFDRISKRDEETGELSVKLTNFETKVLDLQLQEELMLQRCNYMGSQLAILMKEFYSSNTHLVDSLSDQEKLLKEKDEILNSQVEVFIMELCSKEFESFILASQLEEMSLQTAVAETEHMNCCSVLENLKKEIALSWIDADLKEQVLLAEEAEVVLLQKKVEEAQKETWDILLRLKQSHVRITEMDEINRALQGEIQLLKDVACSNDTLKRELSEAVESKMRLLSQVQALEAEHEKLLEDLKAKETALENSSSHIDVINHKKQRLQEDILLLETSSSRLQHELDLKDAELSRMSSLEEVQKSLNSEVSKLREENSLLLQDVEKKNAEVESSLSHIDISDMEIHRLQASIDCLETLIADLQSDLEMKNAEVNELLHSQSVVMADLGSKSQDLQIYISRLSTLKDENALLRNELRSCKKDMHQVLVRSSFNSVQCLDSVENIHTSGCRLFNVVGKQSFIVVDKMFHVMYENMERTSKFINEIEHLENHAKVLVSDNKNLQAELSRKDEILTGLLFDLSLLQESASNTKDQKDKIEKMMASLEALEDELVVKSGELEEAVAHSQMLEAQLQEKMDIIPILESDLAKECESLKRCSCENLELRSQIEEAFTAKCSLQEQLTESRNLTGSLEMELSQMGDVIGKMSSELESLRSNLNELAGERDQLYMELHSSKQKLEKAQAWGEEHEAIAMEAQQMAESRKIYAEEKEAEVKLLERSVEELECTVNVLENKVDILKEEAERQRLQREELEAELHAVNHQMLNVKSADTDMKRHLDEKEKGLEQALKRLQILERDVAEKEAEITQFKAHISELNLHAEAQASEYKQKFKALEAMAEQVKPEGSFPYILNSSSNKSDKNAAKSRGSGSPFKCIGLGLAQQMKCERDEEITAARLHIEELESLAVSRQKEIFTLNAKLAAAESMTHDVIRDLLGVKLDMTNYVSLLRNQQVQKIPEKAQFKSLDPQVKEQEVIKLKQQLNEFIEERQGWLEEIDRKQAEMVAAQIALEKLRQRDQLLKTENEMLKMENVNHKTRVMELEGEVKKLSGQQNLQQRIHHHAKIKEENNLLRRQNEELSAKLHRVEVSFSRLQEELAHFHASAGKDHHVNFDQEQQLIKVLKETEDDRFQLAQKLLGLCTSILKTAGITKPVSTITPAVAEEALEQLKNRLASLERELQDLAHKNRIASERIRLSELMPQASPINYRTDENCQTPRRGQAPFLSALDR